MIYLFAFWKAHDDDICSTDVFLSPITILRSLHMLHRPWNITEGNSLCRHFQVESVDVTVEQSDRVFPQTPWYEEQSFVLLTAVIKIDTAYTPLEKLKIATRAWKTATSCCSGFVISTRIFLDPFARVWMVYSPTPPSKFRPIRVLIPITGLPPTWLELSTSLRQTNVLTATPTQMPYE